MTSGRNIDCSDQFCASPYYKTKYKICRAAFVAKEQMNRANLKMISKDRQRIIQACYDGLMAATGSRPVHNYFEKILGLLGVSGYETIEFDAKGLKS